jgi:DNA-directed RNA polymerase subunit beta
MTSSLSQEYFDVFPSTKSFANIHKVIDVPDLIDIQRDSFKWFAQHGLKELFDEISPIEDNQGQNPRFSLKFIDFEFEKPKLSEGECRSREKTFEAALYVTVSLRINDSGPSQGEIKEQRLYIGLMPIMTNAGTFIINGAERVVVSQLVRSPGVYFAEARDTGSGRPLASAKLIPYRGAWMEFETSNRDVIYVKLDRKRKTPVTTLLRAMGYETNQEIIELFEDIDTNPDHQYIASSLSKDSGVTNKDEALLEFYRRLRPGEPPNAENAKVLINSLFFDARRYDLGKVGRYKLDSTLKGIKTKKVDDSTRILAREDVVGLLRRLIQINNSEKKANDIDHLGNRRVRGVGELIQNQVRVGFLRMERVIRERMTIQIDPETTTPAALINVRPVVAAVREFFGGSQLSQFMDQANPLAELTHKRRLSALGPGGLSRERAGFDVRDVHHSHYGKICPIETPEGPNIGLLVSLATYAKTNEYGFIETPYRKILTEVTPENPEDLLDHTPTESIIDYDGKTIVKAGTRISKRALGRLSEIQQQVLNVKPYVSNRIEDIVYLSADDEEEYFIAQANSPINGTGEFINSSVETRKGEEVGMVSTENVKYMDVSPLQLVSVSTSLIPFLEHDDANRALMGSNMQRQAVPLLKPESPVVGTGMEGHVAKDSGQLILSQVAGTVTSVTGTSITVTDGNGQLHIQNLTKFRRSNQGTCLNQRPIVNKGDSVIEGTVLADGSSTENGKLALGQNILVAFMTWEGYNFEDAIILSNRLIKDDKFTSIHIEKHEIEARDTKLGPEEITRDIPNIGEDSLRNLDEDGIIRIGAEVNNRDILVGKITPKGETELSAEEKLLRAIFGEKARDVKDSSLYVPHGQNGKVIDVKVLEREKGDDLSPGVNKLVRVWIAETRKITQGDKMAGRHGNKGVVSKIMPEEDMPFLPDGTPIDIILTPIGVPSRMNLGQVLETHLGWAAKRLGFNAETPVFDGAKDISIEDELAKAWIIEQSNAIPAKEILDYKTPDIDLDAIKNYLSDRSFDFEKIFVTSEKDAARYACLKIWIKEFAGIDSTQMSLDQMMELALTLNRDKRMAAPVLGKSTLYDGRTGEAFDQPITVGYIYMLKLIHLVEDKIHARATGPYSLITQQPLGGKAQLGGQRFGEMEVWALEAYSAAHNLREMLTIKSDDEIGRVKTYEAIVKGEDVAQPGIPQSFHVLMKELQSLGLSVKLESDDIDLNNLNPEMVESEEIKDPLSLLESVVRDTESDNISEGANPSDIPREIDLGDGTDVTPNLPINEDDSSLT